ncbi:MAG: hypothetical protein ACRDSE_14755 [Pseudonocardiaceae bacterium]
MGVEVSKGSVAERKTSLVEVVEHGDHVAQIAGEPVDPVVVSRLVGAVTANHRSE